MAAFLRALATTHSVSEAARSVGMSRQSAYKLRARLKGKPFDLAWDAAFHQSYQNLPYAALDRALNGIEVPHYYKGELIGTSRRFDERLTVALLKLAGNPKAIEVGCYPDATARQGERFRDLLACIEAEGEDAALRRDAKAPCDDADEDDEDDLRANPPDVSPMSDEELMAELRGF